jgi:Uma2 family endonuclease
MSGMMDPHSRRRLFVTTAPIYPQADPWTVDDLDQLPEYLHAEILDGSLIVSPPPTSVHQVAATRLAFQIQAAMPDDREVVAPAGVEVRVNYLIPDIAVVAASAVDARPMRFDPADIGFPVTLRPAELTGRRHR